MPPAACRMPHAEVRSQVQRGRCHAYTFDLLTFHSHSCRQQQQEQRSNKIAKLMRIETPNMQSQEPESELELELGLGTAKREREREGHSERPSRVRDPFMCFDMCLMPKTATCSEIWGCLPSRVNRAVRSVSLSLPCTHWRWPRPRPRPQFQAPVLDSTPAAVAVAEATGYSYVSDAFGRPAQMADKLARRPRSPTADCRQPTAATANTVAPFVEWNAKCETRNANRRQRDNNKFACQHFLKPQVPSCVSGMPLGACNGSQHRSD